MVLSSTQALVLQTVTWKVRVERKKGNEVVTLTAQLVSDFILEKFRAGVSPKASQNALRSLTELSFLTRHEFQRDGFKTMYAYGLGTCSAEVPVVFLETSRDMPCPSSSPQIASAGTSASSLYNSSNNKKDLLKGDAVDELRSSGTTLPTPTPKNHPSQPFVAPYRSTGLSSSITKVEGVKSLNSLEAIEKLCQKIGEGMLPVPSSDPEAYVKQRRDT